MDLRHLNQSISWPSLHKFHMLLHRSDLQNVIHNCWVSFLWRIFTFHYIHSNFVTSSSLKIFPIDSFHFKMLSETFEKCCECQNCLKFLQGAAASKHCVYVLHKIKNLPCDGYVPDRDGTFTMIPAVNKHCNYVSIPVSQSKSSRYLVQFVSVQNTLIRMFYVINICSYYRIINLES